MPKEIHTIAIYGLSINTQTLLEQIKGKYNIVGLLDGYKQDGEIYGQKIISIDEAIAHGVQAVIVVARPSSCRIIVNRIRKVCLQHSVRVFDTYGKDLLSRHTEAGETYAGIAITRVELLEKIDNSDVISFDIFDTLVTRNVLYPTDVFELVERKLVEEHGQGYNFAQKRAQVEHTLSQERVPTIDDIYMSFAEETGLEPLLVEEIRKVEWKIESSVIIPRYDMCEVLRYAVEHHKKVCLVSDMYYSGEQLKQLLTEKGIAGFEMIIVSCEHGVTKSQGLFEVMRQAYGGGKYLHIGDDYSSDIVSAEAYGIESVWIRSSIDMFDMMPWSEEFTDCYSLEERVKMGIFKSRIFNSPFAVETGNLYIEQPENLGYLLLAPVLTDFCLWLYEKMKDKKDVCILFGARDGYLIRILYDILLERKKNRTNQSTVYFLISRISAVSASLFNETDVLRIVDIDFNGSLSEMLKTRFMLTDEELDESDVDIARYTDLILRKAEFIRERYKEYISNLKIEDKEIVFYDFVSSGTCQVALEKILNKKMHGYYFMQVKDGDFEKKQLSITSFFDDKDAVQSVFYEDYFVLENILTSPMPSFKGFNDSGEPQYVDETRSDKELEYIDRVHSGIIEYFRMYLDIIDGFDNIGKGKCSEKILGLFHKIPIENECFKSMVWEDGFFKRSVRISELM